MIGAIGSIPARVVAVMMGSTLLGCGIFSPEGGNGNGGSPPDAANYLGWATCRSCHPDFGALHALHSHSQALKLSQGVAPSYPVASEFAGVPTPPAGFGWSDISFVIGGYSKGANFVNADGFVLTDGWAGTPTQYTLRHLLPDIVPGFLPFRPDQTSPPPFSYTCFRCHTTGAQLLASNGGQREGHLPGVEGPWAEVGVQCEACHGPGSKHVPNPSAGNIILEGAADACKNCHVNPDAPDVLAAADGFIVGNQQYAEVQASPHASFSCTFCHNPHASALHDRGNGLRNRCQNCHVDIKMRIHGEGKIFVLGDYVEHMSCETCHMTFAAKNVVSAAPERTNGLGRIGDTRTHLMYVDVVPRDFTTMFSPDGQHVLRDSSGKARITLDFVCLRCHTGKGSAFPLDLVGASVIADGFHDPR